MTMASGIGIDAITQLVRGWIQSSLQEYEQIASLCNAQSLLINAVEVGVPLSPSGGGNHFHDDDGGGDDGGGNDLDLTELKRRLHHQNLHDALSRYYQEIDIVRKTHAAMKSELLRIRTEVSDVQTNGSNDLVHRRHHDVVGGGIVEALNNHIELSERVIRTVMKSSSITGQCGVLFENGIVRTSSSSSTSSDGRIVDHEVNVVAMASLRASVSRLKANFGGDDNR